MESINSKNGYRILILIPRYVQTEKKYYLYTFPLGMAYISSVLKEAGWGVDCLNLNHFNGKLEEVINCKLDEKDYDFIATGNNALGYPITKQIIEIIRSHKPGLKIILGGPIITTNPKLIYDDLKPDFGVIGEAEETIIELLRILKEEGNLPEVNGIIYSKDGEIIITEKRVPKRDINSMPLPDFDALEFEELLENMPCNQFYQYNAFDNPRVYPILGSRSCPFNCTFCYHEGSYRVRSVDNIMNELDLMVRKYGINVIILYDDCFAIDKERLKEFCERIKELREELDWELKWYPQLTVRDVTPEILRMMKDSGCDAISFGFESYSQKVLNSMKKPITPEQIDRAIKLTREVGLGLQGAFIFGDPAETKETAKETLDYWKKNAQGQIWLDFVQPYPGSEIYKYCLREGIIKDEIEFMKNLSLISNNINMTKMDNKEFNKMVKDILNADGKYSKFVVPSFIKESWKKNYYEVNVTCPFCRENITYKNCYIENKHSYSFNILCRKCCMRFFVASFIRKIAYPFQGDIRGLRRLQIKMRNYFNDFKR